MVQFTKFYQLSVLSAMYTTIRHVDTQMCVGNFLLYTKENTHEFPDVMCSRFASPLLQLVSREDEVNHYTIAKSNSLGPDRASKLGALPALLQFAASTVDLQFTITWIT